MQNIIKIDKVKTFENKLIIGFNVPKELEKYFNENEVFIEYDFNINDFHILISFPFLSASRTKARAYCNTSGVEVPEENMIVLPQHI